MIDQTFISKFNESLIDSWKTIQSCSFWVILTVLMFWSLLFLDMIGDVNGLISGVITLSCFFSISFVIIAFFDSIYRFSLNIQRIEIYLFDFFYCNKLSLYQRLLNCNANNNLIGSINLSEPLLGTIHQENSD